MAGSSSKTPIESASASASASPLTPACPQLQSETKSNQSVPIKSKKRLFLSAELDIEDYGNFFTKKKNNKGRVSDTYLDRFRSKRGLFVTDVSGTEWCEMQMEFSLFDQELKNNNDEGKRFGDEEYFCSVLGGGRSGNNEPTKAGIGRHVELHREILQPVKVTVKSWEDYTALKLVNFVNGVNQLLTDGLTRELPIVSFAFQEGIWIVGKIDEVRMETDRKNPTLVEIKTRGSDTVPLEPQRRNGKIQLMCYKYLWDNLVFDFPCREFYDYFELNPKRALCEDVKEACANYSGSSVLTLGDMVTCYQNTCKTLPRAHAQLVLRYESQRDKSLIDEENFAYNVGWLKKQIGNCLEFWLGRREANFVAEEEEWKCGHCNFVSQCPAPAAAAYNDDDGDDDDDDGDDFSSDEESSYYY